MYGLYIIVYAYANVMRHYERTVNCLDIPSEVYSLPVTLKKIILPS